MWPIILEDRLIIAANSPFIVMHISAFFLLEIYLKTDRRHMCIGKFTLTCALDT